MGSQVGKSSYKLPIMNIRWSLVWKLLSKYLKWNSLQKWIVDSGCECFAKELLEATNNEYDMSSLIIIVIGEESNNPFKT